jgi:penicillin V acylase-like amidase (Ntn superfamily)
MTHKLYERRELPHQFEGFAPAGRMPRLKDGACTALCLQDGARCLVAANYDNEIGDGLLFVNKRGVRKSGWADDPGSGQHAVWTSKYGSVTFNLVMQNSAWGGMNEAGLAISTLFLAGSRPPSRDDRPWVDSGTWVQYVLDTCATVDDAIGLDARVRIREYADHYLVGDRNGECAAIEFVDGRMVWRSGDGMPARCLANSTYEESLAALGGSVPHDASEGAAYLPSLERFRIAAERSRAFRTARPQSAVDYAFETLAAVGGSLTQWSLVLDCRHDRLFFRDQANVEIRCVDLSKLEFSCATPVRMLDVRARTAADVTHALPPYSTEAHFEHALRAWARWGTPISAPTLRGILRHMEGFSCAKE